MKSDKAPNTAIALAFAPVRDRVDNWTANDKIEGWIEIDEDEEVVEEEG